MAILFSVYSLILILIQSYHTIDSYLYPFFVTLTLNIFLHTSAAINKSDKYLGTDTSEKICMYIEN